MALTINHFRFGIDELAENTHGWHANLDTNPAVIALNTVFLLRFNAQASGGVAHSNIDFTFEFRINGGAWTTLTTTSVGPRAVAAAALTNGGNCTQRLGGTGTFESSGAGQTEDGTSGGTANDIVANGCSETECGIIIDSADVAGGDVIEFRLSSPDLALTNSVVPTVTVPSNTFQESGADTVAFTETEREVVSKPRAETVSLTENLSAVRVAIKTMGDTLSLVEGFTKRMTHAMAETVALTEARLVSVSKRTADTLNLTEGLTALRVFVQQITDPLGLTETLRKVVFRRTQETLGLSEYSAASLPSTGTCSTRMTLSMRIGL